MVDRRKCSQQNVRSCPGKGWEEATWSKQVGGRSSSMRRPRMEKARGKEGGGTGALCSRGLMTVGW